MSESNQKIALRILKNVLNLKRREYPDLRSSLNTNDPVMLQKALDNILFTATDCSDCNLVELSHKAGARTTCSYKDYPCPAFHLASYNGDLNIVKYFLSAGLDVNSPDKSLKTPLHWAAMEGRYDCVVLLVESGANVHARDKNNDTAMSLASMSGMLDTIQFLKHSGADVNTMNNQQMTPLSLALYNGYFGCISYLIEVGASLYERDNSGLTLEDISRLEGKWPFFTLRSRQKRLEAC